MLKSFYGIILSSLLAFNAFAVNRCNSCVSDMKGGIIYQILVDRFYNGNTNNDFAGDANHELTDPTHSNWFKYWGGDIRGVIMKLDYLKNMGVSMIWVTPLYQNTKYLANDGKTEKVAPYHGYWIQDFMRVEEHFSDRGYSDYDIVRELIFEAHKRGIQVILDTVLNHSNKAREGINGAIFDNGHFLTAYDNDILGWYHHADDISDFNNQFQLENLLLAGLADFNQDSESFQNYMEKVHATWLSYGFDGFRIDTIRHIPNYYWRKFASFLKEIKDNIYLVGEFFSSLPNNNLLDFTNTTGITVFDFTLRDAVKGAFAKGYGFWGIDNAFRMDGSYVNANDLATFVDNHDVPRLLDEGATPESLRAAMKFLMIARGTPTIYYGTEQYLKAPIGKDGCDPYNRAMMPSFGVTNIYADIAKLSQLRRYNKAIQKGYTYSNYVSQNVFAFEREYDEDNLFAVVTSENVRLKIPNLRIEDGIYSDYLTGRRFEIKNHTFVADLSKWDVVILQKTSMKKEGNVYIQVNGKMTHYGQSIYLELSGRNKPIKMNYINLNTWAVNVDLPIDSEVLYRFHLIENDNSISESTYLYKANVKNKIYTIWKASFRKVR